MYWCTNYYSYPRKHFYKKLGSTCFEDMLPLNYNQSVISTTTTLLIFEIVQLQIYVDYQYINKLYYKRFESKNIFSSRGRTLWHCKELILCVNCSVCILHCKGIIMHLANRFRLRTACVIDWELYNSIKDISEDRPLMVFNTQDMWREHWTGYPNVPCKKRFFVVYHMVIP